MVLIDEFAELARVGCVSKGALATCEEVAHNHGTLEAHLHDLSWFQPGQH